MNQLDAITTLLEATADLDDQRLVRQARKVLAKKAEKLRLVRARRFVTRNSALVTSESPAPAVPPAPPG